MANANLDFSALTATRTFTFSDASGTMTALGNTVTGTGSIVLATAPTFASTITVTTNAIVTGKVLTTAGLGVGNSASATTLGTVVKKIQVFDASGVSLGYLPVYDAIT
jgi:urocanate hydratase